MTHPTDLTQKERVKEVLRSAGKSGVCSLFLYDIGLPNGRTRVGELRDDDGLAIETTACDAEHDEGTPHHVRYLWRWWDNVRQMELLAI